MFFRLPDASKAHVTTIRARGKPSGRFVRMDWGGERAPRPVADSSAYSITALPSVLEVSG